MLPASRWQNRSGPRDGWRRDERSARREAGRGAQDDPSAGGAAASGVRASPPRSPRVAFVVKLEGVGPTADVVKLRGLLAQAKPARAQARDYERQAQALYEQSSRMLGVAKGQTRRTDGTGLNVTLKLRDLLLALNRGQENALEPWGFTVIIGRELRRTSLVSARLLRRGSLWGLPRGASDLRRVHCAWLRHTGYSPPHPRCPTGSNLHAGNVRRVPGRDRASTAQ